MGDPKQFLIAGSINDRRVRILVDTGATISFIKSNLVPLLTPSPKVEKSELAVVLGNGETQDTDFFIDVDLRAKHCKFDANLHLLELPDAFDVIVGLDWLSRHDCHVRVRGRSLEIGDTAMGIRITVAGCGEVNSDSSGESTSTAPDMEGSKREGLCVLHRQGTKRKSHGDSQVRSQDREDGVGEVHDVAASRDTLHVDLLDREHFMNEICRASKVPGAFVLASIHEFASPMAGGRSSRKATNGELQTSESRRGGDSLFMSSAQKRAYLGSADDTQKAQNAELKKEFERLRACVLPSEQIDQPDPSHKAWADDLMSRQRQYKCLREMPETTPQPGDPTLTIEEKDGLTERPPHRQYKTPRHLLPELEKFITEMLSKKWIEPSKSEYSSPVLIIPKPNGKGYRFVVDLRAINDRTKRINYYMPDITGMFEKLKGAAYISCLDLEKGYWQAPLDPETKHKTAFSCEFGSFQYRVVPMGLLSSAQFYQSFVDILSETVEKRSI